MGGRGTLLTSSRQKSLAAPAGIVQNGPARSRSSVRHTPSKWAEIGRLSRRHVQSLAPAEARPSRPSFGHNRAEPQDVDSAFSSILGAKGISRQLINF
jgi:hypothetical protein